MGAPARAAIFLDRDGVLNRNIDGDYVRSWDDWEWLPGALEGLRILHSIGRPLVVVTNQALVGRGYRPLSAVEAVHRRMAEDLAREGVTLAGVFVCPHHPDAGCPCRKPKPGLLHDAATKLGLDLPRSVMIGDRDSDEEAAKHAGCAAFYRVTRERPLRDVAVELRTRGLPP